MPAHCAVLYCPYKYSNGQNVRFHNTLLCKVQTRTLNALLTSVINIMKKAYLKRVQIDRFPMKNKDLLQKWIEFTQRPEGFCPSTWMSICSQHFRNEDYRSLKQKTLKKNAVPSIRHETNQVPSNGNKTINTVESKEESSDIYEPATKCNKVNSNCRFCGLTNSTFIPFEGNKEIIGVIQKCLPTLVDNIRQDDNMPKEICLQCLKRLKNFESFIDKILETQTAFQYQYKNSKTNERIFKIKQEPVVRVKQENTDEISAVFQDDVDDGCGFGEQDNPINDETQMDQKFQFDDFPVLTNEDIINNCDIVEVINVGEPFIDITNCENTLEEETHQQKQQNYTVNQQTLPSTHELLQSHRLEHNYASFSEDLKEEWNIRQFYKKEKIEAEESEPNVSFESSAIEDSTRDINSSVYVEDYDVTPTMTITPTARRDEYERSKKPIVTSVSSLNDGTMLPITNIPNTEEHQTSRKKPNIVVLNESIVQSSEAFPIQACNICQSKFFSIDSLHQHYFFEHNLQVTPSTSTTKPMVMVPSANLSTWDKDKQQNLQIECQSYKREEDTLSEMRLVSKNAISVNTNQPQTKETPKRNAKNEIKILDMQQTFPQHQYHYLDPLEQNLEYNQQHIVTTVMPKAQQLTEQNIFNSNLVKQHNATNAVKKKHSFETDLNDVHSQFTMQYTNIETTANTKAGVEYDTFYVDPREFLELKKRYQKLKQKHLKLVKNRNLKKDFSNTRYFSCRICTLEFVSIFKLLRHKQTTPLHHIRKPARHFFASCTGCKKFFSRKIALDNHMRYICKFLPSCLLKNEISTFKCRFCNITLTHRRFFRKHEKECQFQIKQKVSLQTIKPLKSVYETKQLKSRRSQKIPQSNIRKQGLHKCHQCEKVCPTLSSLNQHLITHTNQRKYKCNLCGKTYKRRNGLTQHISSYHNKFKPHKCPICKHEYALKGDMKRCKHSALSNVKKK